MKCMPDILRYILLEIEKRDETGFDAKLLGNDEYDGKTITSHAILLADSGYIKSVRADTFAGNAILIQGMTLKGYAFLDEIRDDRVWLKVLKELASAKAPVAVKTIEQIAKHFNGKIEY